MTALVLSLPKPLSIKVEQAPWLPMRYTKDRVEEHKWIFLIPLRQSSYYREQIKIYALTYMYIYTSIHTQVPPRLQTVVVQFPSGNHLQALHPQGIKLSLQQFHNQAVFPLLLYPTLLQWAAAREKRENVKTDVLTSNPRGKKWLCSFHLEFA